MRCTDILDHDHTSAYGFIKFHTYLLIIPEEVSTIYILTEPLNYENGKYGKQCEIIQNSLMKFLSKYYSDATILIRRGHPHDSMTMIAKSKLVISCPSTFSFWFSIINNNDIYFISSRLIFHSISLIRIKNNFHWMHYPKLIHFGDLFHKKSYSNERILYEILKKLGATI